MRRLFQTAALGLGLVLSAASASRDIQYTASSSRTYPAKPANCHLELLTAPPQRAYEELGVFDIDTSGEYVPRIRTASALRSAVGARACGLGGDALLGFASGDPPTYNRATVLRWTVEEPPQALPEPPPIEAAPVPPQRP
jgi:hypothetical protein